LEELPSCQGILVRAGFLRAIHEHRAAAPMSMVSRRVLTTVFPVPVSTAVILPIVPIVAMAIAALPVAVVSRPNHTTAERGGNQYRYEDTQHDRSCSLSILIGHREPRFVGSEVVIANACDRAR
jgi:hypothetical protein